MAYKIEKGIKKFIKVTALTFIAAWTAAHGTGVNIFTNGMLLPIVEASLLAGAIYWADNLRKHK